MKPAAALDGVSFLELDPDRIPASLKALPRWVVWRGSRNPGEAKINKIPRQTNGQSASSTDPTTWTTYDKALAAYQMGDWDGLGFVLNGDGLVGLDLDHCRDPQAGVIEPWAAEIAAQVGGYSEISPSGTGVRIFVKGTLPPGRRKKRAIEAYDAARFLTITGAALDGPTDVPAREAQLNAFHALHLGGGTKDPGKPGAEVRGPGNGLTTEGALALCMKSERFAATWQGDHDFSSRSEAEMSVLSSLAYTTAGDPEMMLEAFRESALWMDKCERTCPKYSIPRAIQGREGSFYDPAAGLDLLDVITEMEIQSRPRKATPVAPVGFTARELQGMDVAPPRWLVEKLIPLGLLILAGPPKVGKSFLLLQAAHAVASGRKLLANETHKAGVAYLALEDGPSRLKKRMGDLFGSGGEWPTEFHFFTSWPRLGEGGAEALGKFLDEHPTVKLVIVDTWGRFRSTSRSKNLDAYQQDTVVVGALQTWAKERELALVLVTHLRKSGQHAETDPFDRVTGSNGQFGAADAAALLSRKRGSEFAQLLVVGRDLEADGEIQLIRKGAAWELANGLPRARTEKQQGVLDYLCEQPGGAGPKEIAVATGQTERYVKQDALRSLVEQGLVRKVGHGLYVARWFDDL